MGKNNFLLLVFLCLPYKFQAMETYILPSLSWYLIVKCFFSFDILIEFSKIGTQTVRIFEKICNTGIFDTTYSMLLESIHMFNIIVSDSFSDNSCTHKPADSASPIHHSDIFRILSGHSKFDFFFCMRPCSYGFEPVFKGAFNFKSCVNS